MRIKNAIFFIALISIVACNNDDITKEPIVSKGSRKFGLHITYSETNAQTVNYEAEFNTAGQTGMTTIPILFLWTSIETTQGWDFTFPDIANIYYPAKGVDLVLTVSPIYAINKIFPSDISTLEFDDPTLISRYNAFLDSIHSHIKNVNVSTLIIGNEADLYLGSSLEKLQKYKVFYDAARIKAKSLWGPSLKVGVEVTYKFTQTDMAQYVKDLTKESDVGVISYYPLNDDFTMKDPSVVSKDVENMVQFYQQPIIIEETGYASSVACNSSEEKQQSFIEEMFKAWDKNHTKIDFIGFLWLTDLSEESAQQYVQDYGGSNFPSKQAFKEYLRTTGLRTYPGAGSDKPAFTQLKDAAKARGW